MTIIPVVSATRSPHATDLVSKIAHAADLADEARAAATRRAYRSDWAHFESWCLKHQLNARPASPLTVGVYLADHSECLAISTLTRRVSTIATAHRLANHHLDTRHPAIRDVMQGLRRRKGTAQRQATALTTPLVRRTVATCADRLIDHRDGALLLMAFAAALRRSEVVALDIGDITSVPEGLRVAIRRSKGDQEGAGEIIQIGRTTHETCPVRAFETWIAAAGISVGRVFRSVSRHGVLGSGLSARHVAKIVQKRAALAGLDAAAFSGHSMRSGFATSAAQAGIEERIIARQTRHKSMTVLRRYIREGELFQRNLANEIGL